MLSLIEVSCPHCGVRGQIMTPPIGAIIIGPCPQCNELVVVFCGHVLPLQKEIMETGSLEQRRDHLLEALTEFLQERIGKLMTEEAFEEAQAISDDDQTSHNTVDQGSAQPTENTPQAKSPKAPISESEVEHFATIDLKLLDNKAYFKSVFEK